MVLLIPLNILIPIALVVIILIFIVWFIYNKNKKIASKIIQERKKLSKYKQEIKNLQESPKEPNKDFKKLNQNARDFFHDYFKLKYSVSYIKLEKYFKKKNKSIHSNFCREMAILNYQGEQITPIKLKKVIDLFSKIIEEYK